MLRQLRRVHTGDIRFGFVLHPISQGNVENGSGPIHDTFFGSNAPFCLFWVGFGPRPECVGPGRSVGAMLGTRRPNMS